MLNALARINHHHLRRGRPAAYSIPAVALAVAVASKNQRGRRDHLAAAIEEAGLVRPAL